MSGKGHCQVVNVTRNPDGTKGVSYEAALFNGRDYALQVCQDKWYPARKRADGTIRPPRLLNTAPNVSYYDKLMRALV